MFHCLLLRVVRISCILTYNISDLIYFFPFFSFVFCRSYLIFFVLKGVKVHCTNRCILKDSLYIYMYPYIDIHIYPYIYMYTLISISLYIYILIYTYLYIYILIYIKVIILYIYQIETSYIYIQYGFFSYRENFLDLSSQTNPVFISTDVERRIFQRVITIKYGVRSETTVTKQLYRNSEFKQDYFFFRPRYMNNKPIT